MRRANSDPAGGREDDQDFDLEAELNNPHLDLITDYLANELDPGQRAAVERRLETDEAFRDYWAPLIAFWNEDRLPELSEQEEQAESDAAWNEFKELATVEWRERVRHLHPPPSPD